MKLLFFIICAYLLGSIPLGLILGKLVKGIDIREHGSHNIGATNVFRVVGRSWGLLVLLLDVTKGYLAVQLPAIAADLSYPITTQIILAVAAILGQTFPVWLSFKGGKGVATSLGVFLAIAPLSTGMTFGIWVLAFLISRIISLASLIAAVSFPIVLFFTMRSQASFLWLQTLSFVLAAFIFYTHRVNIKHLLQGQEPRLF